MSPALWGVTDLAISRDFSRRDLSIVAVAMASALAVLSFRLSWQEFWLDEYATLLFTSAGWYDLIVTYWDADTHRPVYYATQKAWNGVFGEGIVAARSLPVVLTLLIVPVFFFAARLIQGRAYAVITLLLLIGAPMFVFQGRELRMYCLMNLALAVAVWMGLILSARAATATGHAPPKGLWRFWAVAAAALALAFYAQALAIMVAVLVALWILITVALGILPRWFLWQGMAAGAFYILLILPALQPFFSHASNTLGDKFWVPAPTIGYVYRHTAGAFGYPFWAKPVVALTLVWGLWSLRRSPHYAWLLGLMIFGLPALTLLISLYKPIYMMRVVAWSNIVSVFVLAAGITALRPAILRWGILVAFVVAQGQMLMAYYPKHPARHAFSDVAREMADFDPMNDVLVLASRADEQKLRWYAPEVFEGAVYAFIPENINGFSIAVIDEILRSEYVPRHAADQIPLSGKNQLYVVFDINIPMTDAISGVIRDYPRVKTFAKDQIQLDIYQLPQP